MAATVILSETIGGSHAPIGHEQVTPKYMDSLKCQYH